VSPRFETLPNVEAAVNIGLQAAGLRAYSSSPKKGAVYPHVVSMRLGGPPAEKHALDAPRIQLEVWGDNDSTKSEVLDYARDAWRELLELEEEIIELSDGERVHITEVAPEIGLQWLPDPPTARPRYIASLRVYARRLEPVAS
jgi:hypothetical protein